MRILWLKVGGLWPVDRGGRLRSFHIIKELSHHHKMTMLTTHEPGEEPKGLAEELRDCIALSSVGLITLLWI